MSCRAGISDRDELMRGRKRRAGGYYEEMTELEQLLFEQELKSAFRTLAGDVALAKLSWLNAKSTQLKAETKMLRLERAHGVRLRSQSVQLEEERRIQELKEECKTLKEEKKRLTQAGRVLNSAPNLGLAGGNSEKMAELEQLLIMQELKSAFRTLAGDVALAKLWRLNAKSTQLKAETKMLRLERAYGVKLRSQSIQLEEERRIQELKEECKTLKDEKKRLMQAGQVLDSAPTATVSDVLDYLDKSKTNESGKTNATILKDELGLSRDSAPSSNEFFHEICGTEVEEDDNVGVD